MRLVFAYLSGLLFGLGIALSGMANPAKVLNFFDLAGSWDPSLAFVMGGALVVTAIGYRLIFKRGMPILTADFHLPTKQSIDKRLILGSGIFGIGWGIAGFCPGGALPVLGVGDSRVWIFAGAMAVGIVLAKMLTTPRQPRAPALSQN